MSPSSNTLSRYKLSPYFSKTTGQWRQAYIYTPPDYDRNQAARYPVLYLQHGAGESERGWTAQGRANLVNAQAAQKLSAATAARFDNLFAQGAVSRQDKDVNDADLASKNAAVAAISAIATPGNCVR